MSYRRGFKAEAKRIADGVRSELDLTPFSPLDPWALADDLAVPIYPLSSYDDVAPSVCELLFGAEQSAFSAMLALVGNRFVIVHNDSHAITRQRANIAHEIAHILLFHEGHTLDGGWRQAYNADQEDEAKWLGGILQVSDEACLAGCRKELSVEEAASELGVSEELMRWRRNASGAERRVSRERARRAAGGY
jgi:hypothetical protein